MVQIELFHVNTPKHRVLKVYTETLSVTWSLMKAGQQLRNEATGPTAKQGLDDKIWTSTVSG